VRRIGEILVANGLIETTILQRALVKQRDTGVRLCSLLVDSGAIAADEASVALGEQHGVAAVLQRHIDRRDRSLADLLSAALARAAVALPLGRMGNGDIIVCVRDPSPALGNQLARAMNAPIVLAVAPAQQLEQLVLETYGPDDANEFDVDLSTGPVMSLDLDEDQIEAMSDDVMADLGSLELVSLDDTGVTKDASQHQIPIGNQRRSTLPPANVLVDAPTHSSADTSPLVDAPTYRSQTAIVVDAPSQRSALPPVSRTSTIPPVSRTSTTPPVSRTSTIPPGRAALEAAGTTVARTQTPVRSSLETAAGIAVARTQPPTLAPDPAATSTPADEPEAESSDDLAVPMSPVIEEAAASIDPEPAAAERAPSSSAAPPSASQDRAPELPPAGARPLGATVIPIPSVVEPPAGASRAPPAARAALERASMVASRTITPPPREPPAAAASTPPSPTEPGAAITAPRPTVAVGTESEGAPVPEALAVGTELPTALLAMSARLSEAMAALSAAPTRDAATDVVMSFAAKRWSAALLLEIDELAASGIRGHGAQLSDELAQWVVISLKERSLLQAAFEHRGVATTTPSGHGDVEERLQRLLGMARAPSAIAIVIDDKPGLLLAVGDPDGDDLKTAAADLERLAHGVGRALTRLRGR